MSFHAGSPIEKIHGDASTQEQPHTSFSKVLTFILLYLAVVKACSPGLLEIGESYASRHPEASLYVGHQRSIGLGMKRHSSAYGSRTRPVTADRETKSPLLYGLTFDCRSFHYTKVIYLCHSCQHEVQLRRTDKPWPVSCATMR